MPSFLDLVPIIVVLVMFFGGLATVRLGQGNRIDARVRSDQERTDKRISDLEAASRRHDTVERLLRDYVFELREAYATDVGKAPPDWPEGLTRG